VSNSATSGSILPDATCASYWRGPLGSVEEVCGEPAPHFVADAFFCDFHFEKLLQWAAHVGRAEGSIVYYVQRESDRLIKIGTTRAFPKRFASLQREHGPLLFVGAHRGAFSEEAAAHASFRYLRVAGEWFRPELALLEHILKKREGQAVRMMEGIPPQMDLLELGRIVARMGRDL
jgi:hypothetical protein